MIPSFDVEWLNTLGKLIANHERFQLEGAIPEEFDVEDLLDEEQAFFRVRALADFWSDQQQVDFAQNIADVVIGAHNQQHADLNLILLGTSQKLSAFISLGTATATQTLLEGLFPGILLDPIPTAELAHMLGSKGGHPLCYQGVITGVPSGKATQPRQTTKSGAQTYEQEQKKAAKQEPGQLERVIRGMYGATWAYIVQAHPRPRHKVVEQRMKAIDLLSQVTSRLNVQWTTTKQDSLQTTSVESGSQTNTYSGTTTNYRAQYLIRLLEHELERLDQASAAGQWTTRIYFGARTSDDAHRLASLLLGTLSDSSSRPEPLRAAFCQQPGAPLEQFHTFLTSHEVATVIQLPREEVPGYAIHDYVRFDVDYLAPPTMTLPLGYIQQNGRDTSYTYNISLDALAKHAVVIGVTGSGKTTTVMNLLDRVVEAKKPFMVIEPAKTEYRSLRKALHERVDVRVYTLGNELVAPFRLNPFEFETNEIAGNVSVLTHIDFLKAVFNAAFPLYAPMPQVLETALHEVYEDRGWDIAMGTNQRIPDWSQRHLYPIFPTLTDLYNKVEDVTNRLNYHHEVSSNVKAALKARIGSLRIGSKGLMLDTARGIPMQQLLALPTIFEMESIGSDDEKTFLMGLFLAKLYEYRRLQVATGVLPPGFQHLIVIEEAHRLLQNTSTHVDSESSNMRAQAIEVFTNMLSEMRAYGQGVLVAEQIPSKLAPDVLKNTNMKIVHRLIAQDDRQSIGQTMNLTQEQQRHLGILTPGMAAIYAEGADHAYLVRLDDYKRKITPLIDTELVRTSRQYASVQAFHALKDISAFHITSAPFGGPDPTIFQAALKLLESEKCRWLWSHVLLRVLWNPGKLLETLLRFSEQIESEMAYLPPQRHTEVLHMVIVQGSADLMQRRGAQFGWTYPQVEDLHNALAHTALTTLELHTVIEEITVDDINSDEQTFAVMQRLSKHLKHFVSTYLKLMHRKQGPFVGCSHCLARCYYRAEVSATLSDNDKQAIQGELTKAHTGSHERYRAVKHAITTIAERWVGDDNDAVMGIGYCLGLHAMSRAHFSDDDQRQESENLKEYLLLSEDD